jgi:hypothetical protein
MIKASLVEGIPLAKPVSVKLSPEEEKSYDWGFKPSWK